MSEILVITTGGTIDKVYFDAMSEFAVGESVLPELLREAKVQQPYRLQGLLRKDSLELTDEDRELIRKTIADAAESRIIITHGTDTMTDTAGVLASLVDAQLQRTIVLTGSLSPARFARTDATFNVGMAFAAVQSLTPGVYIVMNGQVFSADRVRKDRSKNAFVGW